MILFVIIIAVIVLGIAGIAIASVVVGAKSDRDKGGGTDGTEEN